ncbi:hypothetical protein HUT06_21760 [Actinomadura sp. NAK00032]|uniref:hypothetical protein n=1 Tax=Actinomadura sp. NAK00032 TaxID=2742128 RepID=UPI0015901A10|nr:hypothetical protein [Actinomadura sp. NAK00032]QKW36330.1 hypothetical protein HUT06_21760 [Actinomadura sp. NAK00032]
MSAPTLPHATGGARRAAEPLGWWTALLAAYLGLAPAISATEIAVGAAAAAAGAAAAVAARRALLTGGVLTGGERGPRAVPAAGPVAAALARLPVQIAADTARITVRGASGGHWTRLPAAPGPAGLGAATLLLSASPASYVGGIDPEHGLVRVHRLARGPSPFERSLRASGLLGPGRDGGAP